jgi:hypothetical protein
MLARFNISMGEGIQKIMSILSKSYSAKKVFRFLKQFEGHNFEKYPKIEMKFWKSGIQHSIRNTIKLGRWTI